MRGPKQPRHYNSPQSGFKVSVSKLGGKKTGSSGKHASAVTKTKKSTQRDVGKKVTVPEYSSRKTLLTKRGVKPHAAAKRNEVSAQTGGRAVATKYEASKADESMATRAIGLALASLMMAKSSSAEVLSDNSISNLNSIDGISNAKIDDDVLTLDFDNQYTISIKN